VVAVLRRRGGFSERLFKNVTPTPSMPPTCFKVDGIQGLLFIISANSDSRTQITLPS
jgi:hypothetical protein